jgi:hypothetical protein
VQGIDEDKMMGSGVESWKLFFPLRVVGLAVI